MGNCMGLYAFWQGECRAYRQWDGTLLLVVRRIPSLRVYCEGPGQELDYAFVSLKYMSVPLLTLCPPRRRWRKTQANF